MITLSNWVQKVDSVKYGFGRNKITSHHNGPIHEAKFIYHGQRLAVLYNAEGSVIQSELVITTLDLPPAATLYIQKHHYRSAVREVVKVTDANDHVHYEVEIADKYLLFNTRGQYLQAVRKS